MSYLSRLQAIDSNGCLLVPAPARAVLLTGQSSFRTSLLSPAQIDFLEAVLPGDCTLVRAGFPYHKSFQMNGWQETGLIEASWRNTRQVGWTLYAEAFRKAVARRLQAAMENTARLVLITGSCGLQMANAAWPELRVPADLRLDVIALGPACLASLRMKVAVAQGRGDVWSRMLYRGPTHFICECSHLNYWESEAVRGWVRERLG